MNNIFSIRLIKPEDTQGVLAIYAPYITDAVISFEYEVPLVSEFAERISTISKEYPWLVCEYNNEIIGYVYSSKHRARTAYQWSAECTVYLSEGFHRLGLARILYKALFDILKLQNIINIYAGITVPNIKSEEFHKSMGFYLIGTYKNVGYKFNKWHDVAWFQLDLGEHAINPPDPKNITEISDSVEVTAIIQKANKSLSHIKLV
ncbi:phosphinothricin acetyltransferase [Mucilaginibacter frigoritolerans]|jgi:L-amino acid N-acyltransferase YncA|uniref:Phosphinothricin acetyltransferase n=1 Tax=Mucilaginibacter frigoritolerans TaxID=652788 RepID=A0A562U576_9SPHI|nr:GNAT family N-acetyltransferase [Mucilaginibacter frigoritolerans]TWJ00699.1 phosphinothricin acetyltransferase [Mucilaginibacter frigoritolerans]